VKKLSQRGRRGGSRRGQSGGRGQMGGSKAAGPGGQCICSNCKTTVPHQIGVPCYIQTCPKCGAKMTRS